jgi:hypothetical protein
MKVPFSKFHSTRTPDGRRALEQELLENLRFKRCPWPTTGVDLHVNRADVQPMMPGNGMPICVRS